MLTRAQDERGRLIPASIAVPGRDYRCCECQGLLRRRGGGSGRRPHFFHLSGHRECRQSGKSERHWAVQQRLRQVLGVELERRFPEISRIADAAWEEHRIVFEVQVSGMSAEELKARNRDYESLGWRVIWILHDARFNSFCRSDAEAALHGASYYYTDIDEQGQGVIYEQRVSWSGAWPERSSRVLPDLMCPIEHPRLHFTGDLTDLRHHDSSLDAELRALERPLVIRRWRKAFEWPVRCYRALLNAYLEKAC